MDTSYYAKLNQAQKLAVDTIEGPVMVIAGPGTGKTQLLALRAANILKKTDTAPQNILCLTYTEVGARNMRERLASLVGQAAYDIRISTYHGFGSELIRQYGEYFNEYGAEQPVDKLGQIAIMHEIYKTIPASNPLWRADVYLKDTLQFIGECKKALLLPEDIRAIADANESYIAAATPILQATLPVFPRMNKDVAQHFSQLLNALHALSHKSQNLPEGITPLPDLLLLDLANAIEAFTATSKTNELTVFKNKWLQKDSDNNWVIIGKREINKLRGAADIYEQYLQALKAKKLFDYDDMIYRAIKGLQENDDLRFSLHEQF